MWFVVCEANIQCNPDNSNSLNTNSCLIRIVAKFPLFLPYIKFEGKTCLIRIGIRTLSVICWHQLIMHVFRPLFMTFSSQLHDFSLHFCYFLCAYAILYVFPDNSNSLLIQFFSISPAIWIIRVALYIFANKCFKNFTRNWTLMIVAPVLTRTERRSHWHVFFPSLERIYLSCCQWC